MGEDLKKEGSPANPQKKHDDKTLFLCSIGFLTRLFLSGTKKEGGTRIIEDR